jgi:hypothetical protein
MKNKEGLAMGIAAIFAGLFFILMVNLTSPNPLNYYHYKGQATLPTAEFNQLCQKSESTSLLFPQSALREIISTQNDTVTFTYAFTDIKPDVFGLPSTKDKGWVTENKVGKIGFTILGSICLFLGLAICFVLATGYRHKKLQEVKP